jgi:Zn-dependent peptidase ImmA (M78 family)
MLEPEIAAHVLGVNFEFHQELILLNRRSSKYEIAGLLDRQARKIAVAEQFPDETVRFTGAHEIGHWVLHAIGVRHLSRFVPVARQDLCQFKPLSRATRAHHNAPGF